MYFTCPPAFLTTMEHQNENFQIEDLTHGECRRAPSAPAWSCSLSSTQSYIDDTASLTAPRVPLPVANPLRMFPPRSSRTADVIICPPHGDDVLLVAAEGHGLLPQTDGVLSRAHAVELLQLGLQPWQREKPRPASGTVKENN